MTDVSQIVAPPLIEVAPAPSRERWTDSTRFGALRAATVADILREAERGYPERWIDLAEWVLEHDGHIGAEYESRLHAATSAPWAVEPGETSDPIAAQYAQPAADFCRRMLEEIPDFETKVRLMLDAIGKGYSVHEKMFGRRDGAWVISDLLWRHPRRFAFDDQGKLRLYDGGSHGHPGKPLDPAKFVVHMPQLRASYPWRAGVLRAPAWMFVFKRWGSAWWAGANEKFGAPIPVAKVPPNTKQNVRSDLLAMLERITQGQGAVLDANVEVTLLEAAGYTGAQFGDFLRWCDEQSSKAIRGTTMATDIGKNGSRAQAEVGAASTIEPRAESDAAAAATTIERQMFGTALALNLHLFGGRMPPIPRMKWKLRNERKIEQWHVAEGVVSENEIRGEIGYPPSPDGQGDVPIRRARAQAPSAPGGAPPALPFRPSLSRGGSSPSPTSSRTTSPLELALGARSDSRLR